MDFKEESYKSFELFNKDWALVTAGPMNDFNTMVIGWGELGSHSGRDGDKRQLGAALRLHRGDY